MHDKLEFNLPRGVTPVSHDIYDLHMTIFWICVAIGIVVFSVMFYSLIFHRKSKGSKAAHFHEHFWLEIVWTIIPILILIAMAIPATRVLMRMDNTDLSELTIKITGYQWKWHYEYFDRNISFFSNLDPAHGRDLKNPNYLLEVDHPLVLPIHKKIRFLITSNDVIHSWWVPELGVKRDAVPGFISDGWTQINRPGIYRGQCAELCGINHGFMPIVVIALTEKEFESWLAQQQNPSQLTPSTPVKQATSEPTITPATTQIATPKASLPTTVTPPTPQMAATNKRSLDDLMKRGEQVYLNTCAVCHQPDGAGMPPTFPALKGSKIVTGPIDQHVQTVLFGKVGTTMQAFKDQLSDEDIAAVITYERNTFGNNTKEMLQPADITAAKKIGKK